VKTSGNPEDGSSMAVRIVDILKITTLFHSPEDRDLYFSEVSSCKHGDEMKL
jgi:hypothetical protein